MPTAGKNTNRTSVTDNGGAPTTYCYDSGDRLTSTTEARYGAITYDGHGNTTTRYRYSSEGNTADFTAYIPTEGEVSHSSL